MTYRYVIGMDVGKYFHHACVLDEHGTQVLSKQVNQHETSLRDRFASFIGKVGPDPCLVDTLYPAQSGWEER